MTGDHPFLVRRNHPSGNPAASRADDALSGRNADVVELEAEPTTTVRDFRPRLGIVLADPPGEYQSIDAAQGRDQRADFARDPVNEQIDCLAGLRGRANARKVRMSDEMPDTPNNPDC